MKAPCTSTFIAWCNRYRLSGEKVSSLTPQHSQKGNRKLKTSSEFYIAKAINEKYLTRNQCSIIQSFKYYCDLIIIENRTIPTNKIKKVSQRTFYNNQNDLATLFQCSILLISFVCFIFLLMTISNIFAWFGYRQDEVQLLEKFGGAFKRRKPKKSSFYTWQESWFVLALIALLFSAYIGWMRSAEIILHLLK